MFVSLSAGSSKGVKETKRNITFLFSFLHSSLSSVIPFSWVPQAPSFAFRGTDVLDQLLEGAVDGRADLNALVEVDGGDGALADAFGGEFEFLQIDKLVLVLQRLE